MRLSEKRGWQFCSRCVMCEREAKSMAICSFHCKAALSLWNKFLALLGVKWAEGIGSERRNEQWRTIHLLAYGGLCGKKEI
ncbi:hypothetical protein H5410_023275 [Solanum commersonii]|uniref:Uncharacterized protein n=1 Tax=Solanum commersonii TaxID=4109 RepID=A0A9J5ZH37_SOLCO|nr:hypothetical protein H5410_023275 [Solanum commersonii]